MRRPRGASARSRPPLVSRAIDFAVDTSTARTDCAARPADGSVLLLAFREIPKCVEDSAPNFSRAPPRSRRSSSSSVAAMGFTATVVRGRHAHPPLWPPMEEGAHVYE